MVQHDLIVSGLRIVGWRKSILRETRVAIDLEHLGHRVQCGSEKPIVGDVNQNGFIFPTRLHEHWFAVS